MRCEEVVAVRRRLRGEVITPPDTKLARCYPERPAMRCQRCVRRGAGLPDPSRISIDGSALAPAYDCLLYVPRVLRRVTA